MTFEPTTLLWGAPVLMLLGGYLLSCSIGRLRRIIFPAVRQRWADATRPQTVALPRAGRYVINIVFPAFTVVTGTAYFSADFAITARASGQPVPYQRYSRFNLFSVRRSDMGGNSSNPLGEFNCSEPRRLPGHLPDPGTHPPRLPVGSLAPCLAGYLRPADPRHHPFGRDDHRRLGLHCPQADWPALIFV